MESQEILVAAFDEYPALGCEDLESVQKYVDLLSGRKMTAHETQSLIKAYRMAYQSDPETLVHQLQTMKEHLNNLRSLEGDAASVKRAQMLYGELSEHQQSPHRSILKKKSAVWVSDDTLAVSVAETDIEGWISYASLCREAQGAGPMVLSVADRARAYQVWLDRFGEASPQDKHAMIMVGAHWRTVRQRWKLATYEQQQLWIEQAPLPPPMTASSLGYFEAVLRQDLSRHAGVLDRVFSPLTF